MYLSLHMELCIDILLMSFRALHTCGECGLIFGLHPFTGSLIGVNTFCIIAVYTIHALAQHLNISSVVLG